MDIKLTKDTLRDSCKEFQENNSRNGKNLKGPPEAELDSIGSYSPQ